MEEVLIAISSSLAFSFLSTTPTLYVFCFNLLIEVTSAVTVHRHVVPYCNPASDLTCMQTYVAGASSYVTTSHLKDVAP